MPTPIKPASVTQRNMRSSRLGFSPGARKSAVSPPTSGITPSPIASEPTAQLPITMIRCFQNVVTPYHSWEWWLP